MPAPASKFGPLVQSHWYSIVEGIHFSTSAFYESVETAIAARNWPLLKVSRVEFLEGSVVSDKRVYLRLSREQFSFDVCAAPWGKDYFFSLRFIERGKSWVRLIAVIALLCIGLSILANSSDHPWIVLAWVFGIVLGVSLLSSWTRTSSGEKSASPDPRTAAELERAKGALQKFSFSDFISGIAIIGNWYDRIRRDTYFRYDSRLLYHQLVSEVVKKTVEEVTAAKGVDLRREWDYSPAFDDLYKKKIVERRPVVVE